MNSSTQSFIQLMKHPVKFRMFLFFKLPSAFFSGVRIKALDESGCSTTVPFKWFSQNPFRSTYFACLAMAAEMSTGVLGLLHIHKRSPAVSMLVVKLEAEYFKKAVGKTTFVCDEGEQIKAVIDKAIAGGQGETWRAKSTGTNERGELIATFYITWSFKAKTKLS